jgi:uncharacterized protein YeaO (DUF488 family)
MIKTKRVYDAPTESDGFRILVDKFWPRGLSKEKAKVDLWLKEVAPSDALRKGFCHDPQKWPEFKRKYFEELKDKQQPISLIAEKARKGTVTLVYGAREERFNNAVALKEYLESKR